MTTQRLKLTLISLTILTLSHVAFAEDWWDGDEGYQSSGGFKSHLNDGKDVGTTTFNANINVGTNQAYQQNGNNAASNAQIDPDTGLIETPGKKIIRETQLSPTLVGQPRKETVGTLGDPNSPGKLGLDEKLVDARKLADFGLKLERSQASNLILAASFSGTPFSKADQDKIDAHIAAYEKNEDAFAEASNAYSRGIQRLTRDYGQLEAKGPKGSGGSGTASPSVADAGEARREQIASNIMEGLTEQNLEALRQRGLSANDYAEKFANGEFKSSQDIIDFLNSGTGKPIVSNSESSAEGAASREGRGADGDAKENSRREEGPVLSIQSGATLTMGSKSADGGNELLNKLATYLGGGKSNLNPELKVTTEDSSKVSDSDKEAFLNFALQWWKKGDEVDQMAKGPQWKAKPSEQASRRTGAKNIFEIATETYTHKADVKTIALESTQGPVALIQH